MTKKKSAPKKDTKIIKLTKKSLKDLAAGRVVATEGGGGGYNYSQKQIYGC